MNDTAPINEWAVGWVERNAWYEGAVTPELARCITVACRIDRPYNIHLSGRSTREDMGWRRESSRQLLLRLRSTMSTYDTDALTRLVLAAHQYHCRVEVSGTGGVGAMDVRITARDPEGADIYSRHPGLERLITRAERLLCPDLPNPT